MTAEVSHVYFYSVIHLLFHIDRLEIKATVKGFPSSWQLCSSTYEQLQKTKQTLLQSTTENNPSSSNINPLNKGKLQS